MSTFTAKQIAQVLGVSPQAVRKRLRGIESSVSLVRGIETTTYNFSDLPPEYRQRLLSAKKQDGHRSLKSLAEHKPRALFHSGVDLNDPCAHALISSAIEFRDAVQEILENGTSFSAMGRGAVNAIAGTSLPLFSPRTYRKIFSSMAAQDGGAGAWGNLHLYIAAVDSWSSWQSSSPSNSLLPMPETEGFEEGPLPENEIIVRACEEYSRTVALRGKKAASRITIDWMMRAGWEGSRESARQKLRRALARYQSGKRGLGLFASAREAAIGRPRSFQVTPELERDIQELYLKSNRNGSSGSMSMVAHVLAAKYPELKAALSQSKSKHSLPVAFREACQRVQGLVELHRGGKRALRSATYAPGLMRLSEDKTRRLYGGEQQSWDDGTINFGVCVPWPYGGDPCSDKWGYKVGRFQLILCHDDATGFIPAWTYVIRPAQSYRGSETGGAIIRAMRDTVKPTRIVLEGGVWQSNHVMRLLEAANVRWVDAKGRPQCKLVENYFNRLWTRLSMEIGGQVGRFRGEDKEMSDLYCACQRGDKNPVDHFPKLDAALEAIERSILWLNEYKIEGRYGSWIPAERFAEDIVQTGRKALDSELGYLAAPTSADRKVRRRMIEVTAEGSFGLRRKYSFSSPDLYAYEGQDVRVYFDPFAEMPVKASVVLLSAWGGKKAGELICEAQDIAPALDGVPTTGVEVAKMIRAAMQRHYTAVMPNPKTRKQEVVRRESESRGAGVRTEIAIGGDAEVLPRFGEAAAHGSRGNSRGITSGFLNPRAGSAAGMLQTAVVRKAQVEPDFDEEEALKIIARLESEARERGEILV